MCVIVKLWKERERERVGECRGCTVMTCKASVCLVYIRIRNGMDVGIDERTQTKKQRSVINSIQSRA